MAPNDGSRHSLPGHGHDKAGGHSWAIFCSRCHEVVRTEQRPLQGRQRHDVCGTDLDSAQITACPDCDTAMVVLSFASTAPPRCGGRGRHRLQRAFLWNPARQSYDWVQG